MSWLRIVIVLKVMLIAGCGGRPTEKAESRDSTWSVSLVEAAFPLRLGDVDFSNATHDVDLEVELRIRQVVNEYYARPCSAGRQHMPRDVYVNTVRLSDSLRTIFVVLLRHYPTGNLDSRILFYNPGTKAFIGDPIDFKVYALYDFEKDKIKPSYLKEMLKIDNPELERLDYNGDGVMDYRLTRLYHNGTFNAMRTCVLSAGAHRIDTLFFREKAFSLYPPMP